MKTTVITFLLVVAGGSAFAQQNEQSQTSSDSSRVKVVCAQTIQQHPLYIVDGDETCPEDINKIDPNEIKAINVFKDKSSTEMYGDKGKYGVIVIEMKKTKKDSGKG